MKKRELRELLFRFYRKRTASFLARIYKAGITGSAKDIHNARLDVKKIFAILDLLKIFHSGKGKDPGYGRVFDKLYKASGRIREIQVNQKLIGQDEFKNFDLALFSLDLVRQETERTVEFLREIRNFRESILEKNEKRIQHAFHAITPDTLRKQTEKYFRKKAKLTGDLLDKGPEGENLHVIRQHLKELSTVLTLAFSVSPRLKLVWVTDDLNKAEIMIGEWHDRVVLQDAGEIFLNSLNKDQEKELVAMGGFLQVLSGNTGSMLAGLMPHVSNIVRNILIPAAEGQKR
jgi:hypothetical protein